MFGDRVEKIEKMLEALLEAQEKEMISELYKGPFGVAYLLENWNVKSPADRTPEFYENLSKKIMTVQFYRENALTMLAAHVNKFGGASFMKNVGYNSEAPCCYTKAYLLTLNPV